MDVFRKQASKLREQVAKQQLVACKCQWFTDNNTGELLTLANEIGSSLSNQGDINSEPSLPLSTVLNVLARFYPQIRTGQIFASVRINRLFVAQTHYMSLCLINPPQVNFLLIGKGVVKRTNAGTTPHMPTDVYSILKYGTNLLQASMGHYLVIIASMTITLMPETSTLPDYTRFYATK